MKIVADFVNRKVVVIGDNEDMQPTELVDELEDAFQRTGGAYTLELQGLNVDEITSLHNALTCVQNRQTLQTILYQLNESAEKRFMQEFAEWNLSFTKKMDVDVKNINEMSSSGSVTRFYSFQQRGAYQNQSMFTPTLMVDAKAVWNANQDREAAATGLSLLVPTRRQS